MTRDEYIECIDTIYNLQKEDEKDFNKFSDANRAKMKLMDFYNMQERILHISKDHMTSMMNDINAIKNMSSDILGDKE
tara:strand:- start:1135 stop:1368 length:234 start_codon:yes stop_codon:yes gene_type:complete